MEIEPGSDRGVTTTNVHNQHQHHQHEHGCLRRESHSSPTTIIPSVVFLPLCTIQTHQLPFVGSLCNEVGKITHYSLEDFSRDTKSNSIASSDAIRRTRFLCHERPLTEEFTAGQYLVLIALASDGDVGDLHLSFLNDVQGIAFLTLLHKILAGLEGPRCDGSDHLVQVPVVEFL